MLTNILKVTFCKNILLLWLTLPEADKSASWLKCFVLGYLLFPLAVCVFRLWCWAEQRSRPLLRPVPCLSTQEVLGDSFLDMITHKFCLWWMVSNYRWFRGFLLMDDELCMWDSCSSKNHNCFRCTETHPWTPKCHQSEIIYNSTSLCSPPSTSITICVVMNSLILPFFIKSVVSETNVLHLRLLNLPCLGQPLE